MEYWVAKHHGVDQFLNTLDNRYLVDPVIASQPNILGQEETRR